MKNVFVLPTDKPSRLYYNNNDKMLQFCELCKESTPLKENRNIYIISDDKIVEGDYGLGFALGIRGTGRGHFVFKQDGTNVGKVTAICDGSKKIILTTDQDLIKDGVQAIDDEFLEWFVQNLSCEEVYIRIFCCGQIDGKCNPQCFRKSYEIIIPNLEIWKNIPEFEGYYQISNLGNVKSLSRKILGRGKHNVLLKEKLLKFSTSTNGYYQVILQKEGFKKIYKVHSLVAICFLNHTPDGTHNVVIDHINEVKMDNRLENLRLIGHRENVSRSMKNCTSTYVGVSWSKNAKKWISQITIEGKTKYLGLFDNEEDANKKYLETLKDL